MVTSTLLQRVCKLNDSKAAEISEALNKAFEGTITSPIQVAVILAQMLHETCGFRYSEELWGPTAAQRRYEGRGDLGNTQPGDGYRYRGRGYFQLTGRANYRLYGGLLGIDLEGNPDLACKPEIAAKIAVLYWRRHGLSQPASTGNMREVTRRINGGYNGLQDRLRYYELVKGLMQPQVILIDGGGKEVRWDGKPTTYGGLSVNPVMVEEIRKKFPKAGGAYPYGKLKVWIRSNGDIVLERA